MMDNQAIKTDIGKPKLSLVPFQIVRDIAYVREFGVAKYGSTECWRDVAPERYKNALLRHILAYVEDDSSVDDESGLPHLWHAACNMAFLAELERNPEHKSNSPEMEEFE